MRGSKRSDRADAALEPVEKNAVAVFTVGITKLERLLHPWE